MIAGTHSQTSTRAPRNREGGPLGPPMPGAAAQLLKAQAASRRRQKAGYSLLTQTMEIKWTICEREAENYIILQGGVRACMPLGQNERPHGLCSLQLMLARVSRVGLR